MSTDAEAGSTWSMTGMAREQVAACGIALSEVYRVLRRPELRVPAPNGCSRQSGYGITVVVDDEARTIMAVQIDGATGENWSDWAAERALFADGDVAGADALLRAEVKEPSGPAPVYVGPRGRFPKRRRTEAPPAAPTVTGHVLDSIHPMLREEITRQVAGDFSRLIVHSSTDVEIGPARER